MNTMKDNTPIVNANVSDIFGRYIIENKIPIMLNSKNELLIFPYSNAIVLFVRILFK